MAEPNITYSNEGYWRIVLDRSPCKCKFPNGLFRLFRFFSLMLLGEGCCVFKRKQRYTSAPERYPVSNPSAC